MNVGIYFPDIVPDEGGGYTFNEEFFRSFLSAARESNHSFVIFTSKDIEPIVSSYQLENVTCELIQRPGIIERGFEILTRNFGSSSPLILKMEPKISSFESLLRKKKIDFMIFGHPFHEPVDIPYVSMVWDLQHRLQPWFPEVGPRWIWYPRERYYHRALQRASYIITGTTAGKDEISLFYGIPHNRIKILPHPVPDYAFRGEIGGDKDTVLKKYGITGDFLLYPAQFWSHKNHVTLLYALKSARETYKLPLSLVLVGSDKGNLGYVRKKVSALGLSGAVHFTGFIPREDLVVLYQNALALVYLTFFGPENLPPLEAFALGCPVIASNVSGSEEQLGDAALLVDPKDSGNAAAAIALLYNDENIRSALIRKGYDRAMKWTGRDFIRGIFAIIDDFERIRRCWDT